MLSPAFPSISTRRLSATDLAEPLLPKGRWEDGTQDSDEEALGGTIYKIPEDEEVAAAHRGDDEELPTRLRLYRKFRLSEYNRWGTPTTVVMYVLYLFVATLITVYNIDKSRADEVDVFYVGARVGFGLWQAICLIHFPTLFMGRRTLFAWGGLARVTLVIGLNVATILFFSVAFSPHYDREGSQPYHNYLLLFMAFTVFYDQQVVDPVFRQLCFNFQGAISADEMGQHKPLAGISSIALKRVARNAGKAVGISDEVIEEVKKCIDGQRIREDEDKALDDWTLTIYKLSKVVSFLPFCASKSSITPGQYRNLVNQMVLYMRSYVETGKMSRDEVNLQRSAPLTFFESFAQMTKFSVRGVPCAFFAALIPRSLTMINQVSVMAWANGRFAQGVIAGDRTAMIQGFCTIVGSFCLIPILGFLGNIVETSYSTKLTDMCRRKMLASTMKGGTEFDEVYPSGKLVDAFSNHLAQLEIYTQYQFVTFFPQLVALISGMLTVSGAYPFASILFVSLIPVMLSINIFTKRASKASNTRAQNDGHFMGKIASAVECRRAIRAGNAGGWVQDDLEDLLLSTRDTHRTSFFRSTLVENWTQVCAVFYIVLVVVPLGIGVIQDTSLFPSFITITTALAGLVMPIFMLGIIQNQTAQFSGSIQTARELMSSNLDEEPPAKASEPKTKLNSLTNSVKLSDIKFRYSEKLPDVIKGVGFNISKGTYSVLCGGSGSGKTTVLNMMMRFRKPYAGSITWDGNDIYETSLDSFREHVGVMFQQTMIYMGSVRDNILFGLPEVPGAVEKAAKDAEIDHFIQALPNGYDTMIGGDATGGMSGGQLQRVCLARALYRKPSILLLDEATSALDAETEHAIIETLVNLRDKEGLTIVSVSHHPSTAVNANNIVMLEYGVIAEEGMYDDLVAVEGGLFRGLVEAGEQDGSEDDLSVAVSEDNV